ncbi:hypothetical protein SPAB_05778 [Salmonella enterica subsp. enterica serovar Paratyphi B str. SPB7]|uniref:Uncharacterized protein n=1 Tax=Salmonella paratyphi B (strain ATCC BAA-1250 / SPB7) TaxID=1016998 RepID=A0A6C6ZAC0_SALPB|nr:hypothetical protein SPAB_05778 [Salmonella enterica subsp. enterica serovar Paratyphi B str. SPB7]
MLTGREVSKDEKITIMLLPVLCSDVSFISRAGCYRAGLRRRYSFQRPDCRIWL